MKTIIILAATVLGASALTGLAQSTERDASRPASGRPPRRSGSAEPNRIRQGLAKQYSIEQAVSDKAQLHTIAFNGLAFITGDFGASTFIPPGKVCDFFGFQYMRDIDAAQKGHNPMFLNRVAGNVLHTLNAEQKQKFLDLAEEQSSQLEALARMRLPLIKAFHRQLDGQIPAGSEGLNEAAVVRCVGDIFEKDAELSLRRAEVMAQVWRSLAPEQKAYFSKMKFGDFNSWPAIDERDKIRDTGRGKPQSFNVAYMTYASEFFSWTAGNLDADTYFCPERHGTYFGGFYMKDMPAMGKRDYDISLSRTGDGGSDFLDTLTAEQRAEVTGIIAKQKKAINETIEVRRAISTELRKYLAGRTVDRAKVLALGRHYGELDGEMSWLYTISFAKVNRTLTDAQRAALVKIRDLDGYKSAEAYLYSRPLTGELELSSTDHFFVAPKNLE
jgi:Spy/CpxP family protein refolding chaperone